MIALVLAASVLPIAVSSTVERSSFQPSSAVARAEVRIRIISGSAITLGQPGDAPLRSARIMIEGEARPARLIEFE